MDAKHAERAAEDAGHELQTLLTADESRLSVAAYRASPIDLATVRRLEVLHPIGVRAVEDADDKTIRRIERQNRRREVPPGFAPAVQDDGQWRQPSRD